MNSPRFSRILLKLSGEILLGSQSFGIDPLACERVADYLKAFHVAEIELGVVIGGGNIFRGINLKAGGIARTPADQMGMLATLMNGIALQQALVSRGVPCVVMSAIECPIVAEPYHWSRALDYLREGKIVLFVGGTGNPYFTTDTAAALRASEIGAEVLLKATKVDGVFDKDPVKYPDAVKYDQISYSQILADKLQVMDATAVTLCCSNRIPIFIFNMHRLAQESINEVLNQLERGTWVSDKSLF